MKLRELREAYYAATRRLTEIQQATAIGGIVAVWAAAQSDITNLARAELRWPLLFFVLSLLLNYIQFVLRAFWFGFHSRQGEKRKKISENEKPLDGDFECGDLPAWGNRWMGLFAILKGVALIAGYVVLAFAVLP